MLEELLELLEDDSGEELRLLMETRVVITHLVPPFEKEGKERGGVKMSNFIVN